MSTIQDNGISDQESITLIVKHSSNEIVIDSLKNNHSVLDLKNEIFLKTGVKPERQKLIGLKAHKGMIVFLFQVLSTFT